MRRRDFIVGSGAAVTWPFAADAQQKPRVPRVGILWHAGSAAEEAIFLTQIQQGLKDLGYVEGRNIALVNTFADEQYERFNSNAAELIRQKVDVLVGVTLAAALAAQRSTRTIPIIFILVPDPVATKLVASLAHPGGNLTGLSTLASDLLAKRLELFKEIVGGSAGIALMVNPTDPAVQQIRGNLTGNSATRRVRPACRFRCGASRSRWAWSATPQRRSPAPCVWSPHRHRRLS
jgi:putative tryptophan/tyrosine transport system substrate-binding protein